MASQSFPFTKEKSHFSPHYIGQMQHNIRHPYQRPLFQELIISGYVLFSEYLLSMNLCPHHAWLRKHSREKQYRNVPNINLRRKKGK